MRHSGRVSAAVGISGWLLAVLVGVALVAGWVDAVVGGGGIIQLPALLIGLPADTPAATVVGTNKISSVAGTAAAAVTYLRQVRVQLAAAVALMIAAGAGSIVGARLVRLISRELFTPLVLVALILIAIYTLRRPRLGLEHRPRVGGWRATGLLVGVGLVTGLWDGLLGPGTGTFMVIGLVGLLGYGFLQATTLAKLANVVTNLAAILVLAPSGNIWWAVGLPMAAANLTGGLLGARTAIRRGSGFIRAVFLVVVALLGLRLAWQLVGQLTG